MCHVENKAVSAPSIVQVKKHYKNAFQKREDFIHYMSKWVINPDAETSIIQYAVEKYGLMPHLAYDAETIEVIAGYIYDTNFAKPHKGHKKSTVQNRHSK